MRFVQTPTPNISPSNGGSFDMRAVIGVGPKGADGSNVLPTDTAIANAVNTPASATAAALSASTVQVRDATGNPVTSTHTYVVLDEFGAVTDIVSEAI